MLIATRLILDNVGHFDHLDVRLGRRTIIRGAFGVGKSTILEAVRILTSEGTSLSTLAPRDAEGKLTGEGPSAAIYLDDDAQGEQWRITRTSTMGDSGRWSESVEVVLKSPEGAWLEKPFRETIRALFDPGSDPERFLDERLSDAKRLALATEVVGEVQGYSRAEALRRAGLEGFKVDQRRIPAGLHPLEDLQRVQAQVFEERRAVNAEVKAKVGAVETLTVGLPADEPPDVTVEIQAAHDEVARLSNEIALQEAAAKAACDLAMRELDAAHERAVAEAARIRSEAIRAAEQKRDTAATDRGVLREDRLRAQARARELDAAHERAVADKSRRDAAAQARAEAQRLKERSDSLTRALRALSAQAAQWIGSSLPGLRVELDDDGDLVLQVETADGWMPWASANEGRKLEIAAAWAARHQQIVGGAQASVSLFLDGFEAISPTRRAERLASLGEMGQAVVCVAEDGPLKVEVVP